MDNHSTLQKLIAYANRADRTDTTPATMRIPLKPDSTVSCVSDFSGAQQKSDEPDPYSVIERSAIHEFDAGMSRPDANMAAAKAADAGRPMAGDADVATWRRTMATWKPAGDDDLPPVPPRTLDGSLWVEWWRVADGFRRLQR